MDAVPDRTQTRLDSFVDRYAARTAGMTASEIRALFAVASRPEVVSLAGGMPNISGLPLDVVSGAVGDLITQHGAVAMQYGSGQGVPELREQITEVMRLEGISAHPDDVVVTVGSQQAVDLVTRIFIDPGDVVICEAPSYVGALGVFKAYQADVVHAEMDADGLVPEALQQAITSVKASGRTIKFLYTIPNFHNPAGVTMAAARRAQVLEICKREGVLVLEDNPYGLLGFDRDPLRALRADEADNVVYLGSFSKTFAPGFRVGWALAPHPVREKLVLAQESATLCPPQFSQMAISAYLAKHDWLGQIKQFREMYRERRDAMIGALDDLMPAGCSWNVPDGGFYVWLTLPPGVDAKAMLPRAVTARVAYVPGTAFFADGFGSRAMRLSYCYPTPERIREGVRRLAGVLEAEIELRATFGAAAPERGLSTYQGYDGPGTDVS
ncbi:PLP-dependent aminotransferase family protein [Nocardioides sp. TRM66260-LWL]|uniref:aminotransferase-like domain-containing protein n=1 Tax=Nocardioides sp. TRM66260-LWL TaxID=2874478 RepID=UPI001CC709F1|nr:PLP-dependent aminotransferase family protein [Nocardioides sp. TRM66260-LWL]MBZ5735563.1 PLP-dependent aminotransferase family protein [Nocardioides sp. TRM66260-LWL]